MTDWRTLGPVHKAKYTVSTPIIGPATGTLAEAIGWLDIKAGAETEYATELWRLCQTVGIDPAVLFAQAAHETGDFSSAWWQNRRNPAGIGITGDPKQNEASQDFKTGIAAARGHVVHMAEYAGVMIPTKLLPLNLNAYDDRLTFIGMAEWEATVRTLSDLTGKWATDPRYAEKIAAKASAIFPNRQEVQPSMAKPTILLIAGHRSHGDAGNPNEKALTPALARSYRDAFRAAGYTCVWLQEADGDNDPDDTVGGLDTVSSKAATWIANQPGECVLFDLHYEGSPARGCFAIIPDITGLKTNAPVFQEPTDTWENNKLDRELGRVLVNGIASRTGLPLRLGIREPGLMDESETGVGGQGYRLATFAYTSPWGHKCVRLVVEHGNHTNPQDLAIIMQPDFTDKCAAAAVAAVNTVYGGATVPEKPDPGYATATRPYPPGTLGWQQLNGIPVYALVAEVEVVARGGLQPLATVNGEMSGEKLKQGAKVKVIGSFATDYTVAGKKKKKRWIILEDGSRAEGSRCRPLLPYQP